VRRAARTETKLIRSRLNDPTQRRFHTAESGSKRRRACPGRKSFSSVSCGNSLLFASLVCKIERRDRKAGENFSARSRVARSCSRLALSRRATHALPSLARRQSGAATASRSSAKDSLISSVRCRSRRFRFANVFNGGQPSKAEGRSEFTLSKRDPRAAYQLLSHDA
jgi:hypothetical protein